VGIDGREEEMTAGGQSWVTRRVLEVEQASPLREPRSRRRSGIGDTDSQGVGL